MPSKLPITVVFSSAGEKMPTSATLSLDGATTVLAGSGIERRTYTTSSAGSRPSMNMARQARSGDSQENNIVYRITAAAHPTAHALCTVPMALPRCSLRTDSAISTAPAAHSPPKPKPCKAFSTINCGKVCANEHKNVNRENQMMVSCKVRTRPRRSETAPITQPPSADETSVAALIMPACPLSRPKAAISAGIARVKICTSSASSAQPLKQAQNVLRSSADTCRYQLNIVSPHIASHQLHAARWPVCFY